MKTERELLEAAAKAAGIEILRRDAESLWVDFRGVGVRPWNPRTDDGDALRLAVALEMSLSFGSDKCTASWWVRPGLIERAEVSEVTNGDPAAATRLAIVRAAAAMAEESPA